MKAPKDNAWAERAIVEKSRGLAIARHLDDVDLPSELQGMAVDRERKDGRAIPDSHTVEMVPRDNAGRKDQRRTERRRTVRTRQRPC